MNLVDLDILVCAVRADDNDNPEIFPNKGETAAMKRLVKAGLLVRTTTTNGFVVTAKGKQVVNEFVRLLEWHSSVAARLGF